MEPLLTNIGQYGIAGAAFAVVAFLYFFTVFKSIPSLTKSWTEQTAAERLVWTEQMAAERKARAEEASADRIMFRDLFSGMHSRLDRIEIKIDRIAPNSRNIQKGT